MDSSGPIGIDFGSEGFGQILTNPFLDIAARFWEEDRYKAFQICYRSMRRLDDLVDDRKVAGGAISPREREQYRTTMLEWLESMRTRSVRDAYGVELLDMMDRFAIPLWPWERLCAAMIYDLGHDGFADLRTFLRYSEGAAVAPASVFVHLCGVMDENDRPHQPPVFDIRMAARPLALFSYFVHIMRDFQKDQLRGLNYFADNLLRKHSLTRGDLRRAAGGGPIPDGIRDLFDQYRTIADYYRARARKTLDKLAEHLKPRYQLSLEVIYGLYHLVFERIDPHGTGLNGADFSPSAEEIQRRLQTVVSQFKAHNGL
jgi:phytoene/squalene synthetase